MQKKNIFKINKNNIMMNLTLNNMKKNFHKYNRYLKENLIVLIRKNKKKKKKKKNKILNFKNNEYN